MNRDEIISRIYALARKGLLNVNTIVWLRYCDNTFRMSHFRLSRGCLRVNQEMWEPQKMEWEMRNEQICIEEYMDEYLLELMPAIERALPKGAFDENLF